MDVPQHRHRRVRLTCAVGTLPALRAAVDGGADWVSFALRTASTSHGAPARVLDELDAAAGIRYAHGGGARVLLTLDTFPLPDAVRSWCCAIDAGADLGVDAIALADPGLMRFAARSYPSMPLHLATTGSVVNHEALEVFRERFGVRRALLPRNFDLAQVERVAQHTDLELEVHAYGGA